MKNPLVLAIIAVVVLGIAGGAFFVMSQSSNKETKETVLPPPEYLKVKGVTANLRSREDEIHYIQVDIAIAIRNSEYLKKLELYIPFIRSSFLRYLSDLYYEDISDPGYIEIIRLELLKLVKDISEAQLKQQGVDDLLLTNIVIQ